MKKLLPSTAILSLALFTHAGASTDIDLPPPILAAPAATTQVAANDLRLHPQAVSVQLVGIGENRIVRSAGLQSAERQEARATTDGVPSTPVALAALLLVVCMLIGRRNI